MENNDAIRLVTDVFDARNLKYRVFENGRYREIHVPFGINDGPSVVVRYIFLEKGNNVMVRVISFINHVSPKKRIRILEVCNRLNCQYRFLKFNLNAENNVDIEYDLPGSTGSESIGNMAFDILACSMQIINQAYPLFAEALYKPETSQPDTGSETGGARELLKMLDETDDGISIRISKTLPENPEN